RFEIFEPGPAHSIGALSRPIVELPEASALRESDDLEIGVFGHRHQDSAGATVLRDDYRALVGQCADDLVETCLHLPDAFDLHRTNLLPSINRLLPRFLP